MPVSQQQLPAAPAGAGADFAAFYDQTAAWVYGLVLRILGDDARAATVLTAAYREAVHWTGLDEPARRARVLHRARELALLERRHTKRPAARTGAGTGASVVPMRHAAGIVPVQDAWSKLEPMDREILGLAYFQGSTVAAIAAAVGESESNVRARLRQALGRVAAHSKAREARP